MTLVACQEAGEQGLRRNVKLSHLRIGNTSPLSSRSSYYQFLSLYKVLQIHLPGPRVATWINAHADDNMPSVVRVRELRAQGVADLASYLYENWRNAIANVEREPRLNPDDVATRTRISQDLPIVRDLARTMIGSELLD